MLKTRDPRPLPFTHNPRAQPHLSPLTRRAPHRYLHRDEASTSAARHASLDFIFKSYSIYLLHNLASETRPHGTGGHRNGSSPRLCRPVEEARTSHLLRAGPFCRTLLCGRLHLDHSSALFEGCTNPPAVWGALRRWGSCSLSPTSRHPSRAGLPPFATSWPRDD